MSELGHVILSHGLESGPNATKVTRLAAVAEELGWSSERPDYSAMRDPSERVQRLRERCVNVGDRPLVLVGSSMGAYISGVVSRHRLVRGLFVLAPPIDLSAAGAFDLRAPSCFIVHGWDDELIPAERVLSFASSRKLPLLMLQDDHRLSASIDQIAAVFAVFLRGCR